MTITQSPNYTTLRDRIEQSHRRSLMRTIVLSIVTVVVAAVFLAFTVKTLDEVNRKLTAVRAELGTAQNDLRSATTKVTDLNKQVSDLSVQLEGAKRDLKEALDLGKQVYKLDWGELKMMFVENGPAVEVLEVAERYKDQVRWGKANTADGGYTSPGFAVLVLQQLHRLPTNGLAGLPRDDGPPKPGDIVVYASGYHMFYFRDHERREFVVGMTPFGVLALNYDFGVKREGVLRSGFPPQ